MKQLFLLGEIFVTPAALDLLNDQGCPVFNLLIRHATGDYGDLCREDIKANKAAVQNGSRVFSSYRIGNINTKVWVITESDRSMTILMLPSEY
jgi:hypothetical protein